MATFNIDPVHEFRYELSCIKDGLRRNLAVEALKKVPDYFWIVPASSSGKYHPKSSLGIGGLERHVKSVCRIAIELLSHPMCEFTPEIQDSIIVACMLHDCEKQGMTSEPTHTLHDHPLLVRSALRPDEMNGVQSTAWDEICDLIDTHMGPWTEDKKDREGRSTIVLPLPTTPAQKFVHMCDFLASRPIIEVDTTDREPQSGYKKSEELATDGQINYLTILVGRYKKSPPVIKVTDSNGNRVLTKNEASDHITKLKADLGIK